MIEPMGPELRYRFHDLTWEYARRRALSENVADSETVPAQVYRALLTLTRRAHTRLCGGDSEVIHSGVPDWDAPAEALAEVDASALAWFEKERLNIRAAIEHCAELNLTEMCWNLAVSAHEFYTIRGYFDDWYATHQVALRACQVVGDRRGEGILLACLNQPTLLASRRSASSQGLAELGRAVSLLAGCGDRHGLAIALRRQGHIVPRELFTEALAHYVASGDVVGQWQTLRYIGQNHLDRGDYQAARDALQTADAIAAELGQSRLLAQTRYWIGQACLAAGDLESAQVAFDTVCDTDLYDRGIGQAYAMHGVGDLALCRGALIVADRHLAVAAELARDGADAVLEGRVSLPIAALRDAQGQADDRIAALGHAAALFAGCGAAYLEVRTLAELEQGPPFSECDAVA